MKKILLMMSVALMTLVPSQIAKASDWDEVSVDISSTEGREWDNKTVEIVVNVKDTDNRFDYVLDPDGRRMDLFQEGECGKFFIYEVSQNGSYTFETHLKDGSYSKQCISIQYIDSNAPEITYKTDNNVLSISASDDLSGIAKVVVNGTDGSSEEKTLDDAGQCGLVMTAGVNYDVHVFDRAGNESILNVDNSGVTETPSQDTGDGAAVGLTILTLGLSNLGLKFSKRGNNK